MRRSGGIALALSVAAVMMCLLGACGDDGGAEGPSAPGDAVAVCQAKVDEVAPGGAVLTATPQSAGDARSTDPGAWAGRPEAEPVITCVFALPLPSSTTACPNGQVSQEGKTGPTISVRVDYEGAMDGEPKTHLTERCTAS
jgi:hypothetical protein